MLLLLPITIEGPGQSKSKSKSSNGSKRARRGRFENQPGEGTGPTREPFFGTVSQVSIRLIRILPKPREAIGFAEAIKLFLGCGRILRPALPDR